MTDTQAGPVISDVGRKYLQLHLADEVGPIGLRRLIGRFGSIDAVLSASQSQLEEVDGIGSHRAKAVFRARNQDGGVEREIDRAADCGARIFCQEDKDYPAGLRSVPDPPICLFVRGRLEPADCVAIAIVGTRRCSHYGSEQASRFGEALGAAGFTVVSGLARGIDSCAHRGALRGGGRTLAVLGNGLGSIYPPEHVDLAKEIAEAGAVVSELATDIAPEAHNFPRRNRIIVGLSLGVIVVEAGRRSGALITARLATEYNREVFAVPGRVDQPEVSAGTNGLLRDGGAKLVTCLEDVLDELAEVGEVMRPDEGAGASAGGSVPVQALSLAPSERAVFDAVAAGAEDAARISAASKLNMAQVTSTLTALQLKGLVRRLPGDRFVRRS